jgi:hypothetical protein
MVVKPNITKIKDLKGKTVAAERARHGAVLRPGLDAEEERPVGQGREGRQPGAAGRRQRDDRRHRRHRRRDDLRALPRRGARQARGRQDHRHHARLPDGDGHLRLHAEVPGREPEGRQGAGRRLLRRAGDDQGRPEEELRDHGRRRQAKSARQFEKSQAYLRWQDRAANQKFFAGEHAQFSKEAADLLLERHHQADPDLSKLADTRFHKCACALASPSRPGAPAGAGSAASACRSSVDEAIRPRRTRARIVLGISFFVLFVAVWAAATFGGFVSKTFLADPLTMVRERLDAADEMGFATTSA